MSGSTIKKISLYSIPIIIGNVIPIITLPIFTSLISVTEFGIFALAQTIATYLSGIAVFGINIGYERNFFERRDEDYKARLFYTVILITLISFAIIGLLYIIFQKGLLFFFEIPDSITSVFVYSYFGLGIVNIKNIFLIFLRNEQNVKSYVWFSLDEIILGFLFQMFFVLHLKIGILGLVLGQLCASLIVFMLLTRKFLKEMPFKIDFSLVPSLVKISLPMTPRIFFGVFGNQFDKYMLGLIGNMNGIGIYNLGQRIAYLTFVFMNAIQNVFLPVVYNAMFEKEEVEGGRFIGKYLTKYFYLTIGFGLLVILSCQEVIALLTPKEFHASINVVSLLVIYYVSCFFGKQPQLIYKKKTGIGTSLSFISIGITVVVNMFTIPKWGYVGAAAGTLFSGMIGNFIYFVVSQYYYKIYWEYSKIGSLFLILLCACITQFMLFNYNISFFTSLGIKLIVIIFFLIIGIRIGTINLKTLQTVVVDAIAKIKK